MTTATPTELDATAPPVHRQSWREKYPPKEVGLAALFLAPSLLVFALFFYLPFFRLLSWGTYKSVRGGQSYRAVGAQQYKDVLTGQDFWAGLTHSLQFVLLTVPVGLVLGGNPKALARCRDGACLGRVKSPPARVRDGQLRPCRRLRVGWDKLH